jgi:hypothetical protein
VRIIALASVAITIAACNVLLGVNDFSTLDCADCERRECPKEFTACIGERECANWVHCLETCSSASCPPCLPPPTDDGYITAALQACAQTHCVCTGPPPRGADASPTAPPPPRDATAE